VTLMHPGHIGWTSSKLITRIVSLGSSLLGNSPKRTPLKFGWNRGGIALLRKPTISLKRDKIGPRLLLMTNIGDRIRAFDWCPNQRPWMALKGHYQGRRKVLNSGRDNRVAEGHEGGGV